MRRFLGEMAFLVFAVLAAAGGARAQLCDPACTIQCDITYEEVWPICISLLDPDECLDELNSWYQLCRGDCGCVFWD